MSTYRYAVKVRRMAPQWHDWQCEGCGTRGYPNRTIAETNDRARRHADQCETLYRINWDAACPSCKLYGRIAKACPVCLGRGWCK